MEKQGKPNINWSASKCTHRMILWYSYCRREGLPLTWKVFLGGTLLHFITSNGAKRVVCVGGLLVAVSVICSRFWWLPFVYCEMFLHLALCPLALKHLMIHCNTLTGMENKRARKYRSGNQFAIGRLQDNLQEPKQKSESQAQNVLECSFQTDHQMAIFWISAIFWQLKYSSNECQYQKVNKSFWNLWISKNQFLFVSCPCIFKVSATTWWYLHLTMISEVHQACTSCCLLTSSRCLLKSMWLYTSI